MNHLSLNFFSEVPKTKLCKFGYLGFVLRRNRRVNRIFHVLPWFIWIPLFLSCNNHFLCYPVGGYLIHFGKDHLINELEVLLRYYLMQQGKLLCILSAWSCKLYYRSCAAFDVKMKYFFVVSFECIISRAIWFMICYKLTR